MPDRQRRREYEMRERANSVEIRRRYGETGLPPIDFGPVDGEIRHVDGSRPGDARDHVSPGTIAGIFPWLPERTRR